MCTQHRVAFSRTKGKTSRFTGPGPVNGTGLRIQKRPNPQPQHAGSQDNSKGKLVLPQLNRLQEALKESDSPVEALLL